MWQSFIFIIVTGVLVYISRSSLLRPASHGFYRFFAWEFILALFVSNIASWFQDPLSWHQLISWLLLVASLMPLVLGIRALRTHGEPDERARPDVGLLGFERTTRLVTTGVYRYIRHPLYGSLFLLAWGIFFKSPSLAGALLVLGASALLVATAKTDERECALAFGTEYERYKRHTRMFIPYVF